MAAWDSPYLLGRCKTLLNRPTTDAAITDPQWYELLTDAQTRWIPEIAAIAPAAMIHTELLGTADSGLTYTFDYEPLGLAVLTDGRDGRRLIPGEDYDDNSDFVQEGITIRFEGGGTSPFSSIYARYVPQGSTIDASTVSIIKPDYARILLVYDACIRAAIRLKADARPYQALLAQEWRGDPIVGTAGLQATLRARFFGEGGTPEEDFVKFWRQAS